MRVLLINAPVARMSPHARLSPPLGIAYLGAYARSLGHTVELLDLNISGYSPRRLDAVMARFAPEVVGISAHTETYPNAVRIARQVKERSPEVPVVLGGPHPSILPEDVLAERAVDFVVVGEGEEPLAALLDALESGSREFGPVPGLGYTDETGVHVNDRAAPGDPERFGLPARDLLSLEFYRDAFNVLTARGGCPYRCPFCSASFIWHGRHRPRAPRAVVDEAEFLMTEYGARFVFFVDDIFTLSRRWLDEFLEELARLDGGLTWGCGTRVDLVDEPMLRAMAAAGCTGIQFGIESGSQQVLDSVKGISKKAAVDAVRWSVAAGISTTVSFMVPFPDDTEETIAETFAFIEELMALGAQPLLSYTTPFPGTQFHRDAAELGIAVLSDDWEQYDCKHVLMATKNLSAERIEALVTAETARLGFSRSA